MKGTIAYAMVETLTIAGVERVHGTVGDSLNGFADALRRHGGIRWLHVRHEEVAASAAGAEAQVTGGLAVCAGSCGPGDLYLINVLGGGICPSSCASRSSGRNPPRSGGFGDWPGPMRTIGEEASACGRDGYRRSLPVPDF